MLQLVYLSLLRLQLHLVRLYEVNHSAFQLPHLSHVVALLHGIILVETVSLLFDLDQALLQLLEWRWSLDGCCWCHLCSLLELDPPPFILKTDISSCGNGELAILSLAEVAVHIDQGLLVGLDSGGRQLELLRNVVWNREGGVAVPGELGGWTRKPYAEAWSQLASWLRRSVAHLARRKPSGCPGKAGTLRLVLLTEPLLLPLKLPRIACPIEGLSVT